MAREKIKKVTIEYEKSTYIATGKDAEAWQAYIETLERIIGLFSTPPWRWTEVIKKGKK